MNILEGFIPTLSPGINKTYIKHRYTGQTILSTEARDFKKDFGLIVGACAGEQNWQNNSKEYKLTIYWWGGKFDVDAHTKIVQDTICEKLDFNDKFIKDQEIKKLDSPLSGYLDFPRGLFFRLESLC